MEKFTRTETKDSSPLPSTQEMERGVVVVVDGADGWWWWMVLMVGGGGWC